MLHTCMRHTKYECDVLIGKVRCGPVEILKSQLHSHFTENVLTFEDLYNAYERVTNGMHTALSLAHVLRYCSALQFVAVCCNVLQSGY